LEAKSKLKRAQNHVNELVLDLNGSCTDFSWHGINSYFTSDLTSLLASNRLNTRHQLQRMLALRARRLLLSKPVANGAAKLFMTRPATLMALPTVVVAAASRAHSSLHSAPAVRSVAFSHLSRSTSTQLAARTTPAHVDVDALMNQPVRALSTVASTSGFASDNVGQDSAAAARAAAAVFDTATVAAYPFVSPGIARVLYQTEEFLCQPVPPGLKSAIDRTFGGVRTAAAHIGSRIDPAQWVAQLPPRARAFAELARVEKPIGTWLLLLPCFWGAALAAPTGVPPLAQVAAFAVGAVVMRGAGCTINDLWDRDIDKRVDRTKTRPLAAGLVTVREAIAFTAAQCLVGLAVLPVLSTDWRVGAVALSAMPFVIAYPLMKRLTNWPQAVLGVTFNWGLWVGYAAVAGVDALAAAAPMLALLHLGGVAWTIFYDTVYAVQDRDDDAKIGVKSTALHFGDRTQQYLRLFAWLVAGCFLAAAVVGDVKVAEFFYPAVLIPLRTMLQQVRALNPASRAACLAAFKRHRNVAMWVLFGCVLAKFAAQDRERFVDKLRAQYKEERERAATAAAAAEAKKAAAAVAAATATTAAS
jgi:4-hydroxybenzoate polyprenyl transferase